MVGSLLGAFNGLPNRWHLAASMIRAEPDPEDHRTGKGASRRKHRLNNEVFKSHGERAPHPTLGFEYKNKAGSLGKWLEMGNSVIPAWFVNAPFRIECSAAIPYYVAGTWTPIADPATVSIGKRGHYPALSSRSFNVFFSSLYDVFSASS